MNNHRVSEEGSGRLLFETDSEQSAARKARQLAKVGATVLMRGPVGFVQRRYTPALANEPRWWFRVACPNADECKNPHGPWMFPDHRTNVSRHCWTPSQRHIAALRETTRKRVEKAAEPEG